MGTRERIIAVIVGFWLTLSILCLPSLAEGSARLDPSFGKGGIATMVPKSAEDGFPSVDDSHATWAIGQDDSGRLMVLGNSRGGRSNESRQSQMIVGRLTKRGKLDR